MGGPCPREPTSLRKEKEMTDITKPTMEIDFRGERFKVSKAAFRSMKVQKKMALMEEDLKGAFEAMDAILCGGLDDALDRIPEADGTVSEYGASAEAFGALFEKIGEQLGKN